MNETLRALEKLPPALQTDLAGIFRWMVTLAGRARADTLYLPTSSMTPAQSLHWHISVVPVEAPEEIIDDEGEEVLSPQEDLDASVEEEEEKELESPKTPTWPALGAMAGHDKRETAEERKQREDVHEMITKIFNKREPWITSRIAEVFESVREMRPMVSLEMSNMAMRWIVHGAALAQGKCVVALTENVTDTPLFGAEPGTAYSREECFHLATECDPNNDVAWVELGKVTLELIVSTKRITAHTCFTRALTCNCLNPDAWFYMSLVSNIPVTVGGKLYTPEQCVLRCLELDESHVLAWQSLVVSTPQNGIVRVTEQHYTRAEIMKKVIELDTSADAKITSMRWCDLGKCGGVEDWGPGKCFMAAVEASDTNTTAWRMLAHHLHATKASQVTVRGRPVTASVAATRAVENSNEDHECWECAERYLDEGATITLGAPHNRMFTKSECAYMALEQRVQAGTVVFSRARIMGTHDITVVNGERADRVQCLAASLEITMDVPRLWLGMRRHPMTAPEMTPVKILTMSLEWGQNVTLAWSELDALLGESGKTTLIRGNTITREDCRAKIAELRLRSAVPWHELAIALRRTPNTPLTVAGRPHKMLDCCVEAINCDHDYVAAWCDIAAVLDKGEHVEFQNNRLDAVACAAAAFTCNWVKFSEALRYGRSFDIPEVCGPDSDTRNAYVHALFLIGTTVRQRGASPATFESFLLPNGTRHGGGQESPMSASDAFVRALEVNEMNVPAWVGLGLTGGEARVVRGVLRTPRDCFLQCLKMEARPGYMIQGLTEVWGFLGDELGANDTVVVGGATMTKRDCFLKHLSFDEKSKLAWSGLGTTLEGNDQTVSVGGAVVTQKDCYNMCLKMDVRYARAWDLLGLSLAQGESVTVLGKVYVSPTALHVRAVEFDGARAESWKNLAAALRPDESVTVGKVEVDKISSYTRCLECSISGSKTSAAAWDGLGVAIPQGAAVVVSGESYTDVQCYLKAIECDAKHSASWWRLGVAVASGATVSLHGVTLTDAQCYQRALECEP